MMLRGDQSLYEVITIAQRPLLADNTFVLKGVLLPDEYYFSK